MKRIPLMIIVMIMIAGIGNASPFLICDPQTGVTSYQLTGPAWVPTIPIPAQADGSIKMDVAAANVGANAITIKACKTDPIWGELCSVPFDYSFTRPASPAKPGGIGLIK